MHQDKTEKEKDPNIYGVRPYLFEPLAEAHSTVGEEEMPVHLRRRADASQW